VDIDFANTFAKDKPKSKSKVIADKATNVLHSLDLEN
jgi:hypothetical protein